MLRNVKWIAPDGDITVPEFLRVFKAAKPVRRAVLKLTCAGVYEACLNGRRLGRQMLMPGWTVYEKRHQVQTFDLTGLLEEENDLTVTVAEGWQRRHAPEWMGKKEKTEALPPLLWGYLTLDYQDGTQEIIPTDQQWKAGSSRILTASIFDGETYDANAVTVYGETVLFDYPTDQLIDQEGEEITCQERIRVREVITTPRGETVLDFGQDLTGVMSFSVTAKKGEKLSFSCAEVLDREGNFYTDNYRSALSRMTYICREGSQSFMPCHTYFGFRYLRVDEAPEGFDPFAVTAVAVHSDMKRTGFLSSSDPLLNRFFSNVLWGQKGNFLDIPTDCPQRDERLGWTGDAQVFAKAACYQYDTERFFTKWLHDMAADQMPDGGIPHVIPNALPKNTSPSAAWGDAAVICPWEVYRAYGNKKILEEQFECMRGWVDYITGATLDPGLWTGGEHYGDWLGLDAPEGSYKGSTDPDLIATAFYARSAQILILVGRELGKDMTSYEELLAGIKAAFRTAYGQKLTTQTAMVLALYFDLAEDRAALAKKLAEKIHACGDALETGFVGTPYLLHVLSENGYADLSYTLLLRKEYPSWLYPVTKGATTVWEHWDGIRRDGSFWSSDMNSFNHYAYGSAVDWVFSVACGIRPLEPGYRKIAVCPVPDKRIDSLSAVLETRSGTVRSAWKHTEDGVRYEIGIPADAVITIDGKSFEAAPGSYVFYGK